MIIVLSLACAALAIGWPQWRDDLRAEGYYGYSYFNLPDTGQTTCYGDGPNYDEIPCAGTGQDGAYNINPLSYTDNGDGTVTDDNTGLMWQKGEPRGMMWFDALNYCENLELGQTDWRLPNIKELESITDDTRDSPAMDT